MSCAPLTLRAGDSATITQTATGYPAADGWAMFARLLHPTQTAIDLTGTPDDAGETWTFSLTATATASWPAGVGSLVWWVSRDTDRITLGQRTVTIQPNLATATQHDGRSNNQRALADAETALAAHMASGRAHVASYSIAGRSMQFRSVDEIRALIDYYRAEVARERAQACALSGGSPGRVITRF